MTKNTPSPQSAPEFTVSLSQVQEWGLQLRAARERRGKTLAEMSVITKIREGFLVGIEEGRWDVLPPGLSGRGLVRNYAKELAVTLLELEPKHRTVSVAQQEAAQASSKSQPPAAHSSESPSPSKAHSPRVSAPHQATAPEPMEQMKKRIASQHELSTKQAAVLPFQKPRHPAGAEAPIVTPQPLDILGISLEPSEAAHTPPPRQTEPVAQANAAPPSADPTPFIPPTPPESPAPQVALETVMSSTQVTPEAPKTSEAPQKPQSTWTVPESAGPMPSSTVTPLAPKRSRFSWSVTLVSLIVAAAVSLYFWSKKEVSEDDLPPLHTTQQSPTPPAEIMPAAAPQTAGADLPQNGSSPVPPPAAESAPVPAPSPNVTAVVPTATPQAAPEATPLPQAKEPAEATAPVGSNPPEEKTLPPSAAEQKIPAAIPGAQPEGAVLKIKEPVQVSVVADGQTLFQGVKPAGEFKIEFKRRAEILIQDGSKATLQFGQWNHGPLGHPGRQRRVTLLPYEIQ